MQKVFFSFPLLSTFSSWYLTEDFQVTQCKREKLSTHAKTCCFFKIKDQIFLFELAVMLKTVNGCLN